MTSPLLALFIRSLREDSRLKFTYLSRAGLVSVLLLVLFTTHSSMGWANAPGLQVFSEVAFIDLLFVALAGVSYFSSAITEEKEEKTLGLLRMTDLNSLSILLGKSTSRLCNALLLFLAQIPFTLLAITLGGISLRQILATYIAIGSFLILVCNVGLFASVICRSTMSAAVITGGIIMAPLAIVPLTTQFALPPFGMTMMTSSSDWENALLGLVGLLRSTSPLLRINEILFFGLPTRLFSFQVGSNLAASCMFFLLAWTAFEKFCGEQSESAPARATVSRAKEKRRLLSPGRAWKRVIIWKDFHFLAGGWRWVMIKFLIYAGTLGFAIYLQWTSDEELDWERTGNNVLNLALVFLVAECIFAAATIYCREHEGHTLSGLAILPQGIRGVAYEKLLGVVLASSGAAVCLCVGIALASQQFISAWKEDSATGADRWDFVQTVARYLMPIIPYTVQAVFFLHVVAFLSLYTKRSALPLAIAGYFLAILISDNFPARSDWTVLTLLLCTLTITAILHRQIGRRLEILAAEE